VCILPTLSKKEKRKKEKKKKSKKKGVINVQAKYKANNNRPSE
jgi:hypothetical protein